MWQVAETARLSAPSSWGQPLLPERLPSPNRASWLPAVLSEQEEGRQVPRPVPSEVRKQARGGYGQREEPIGPRKGSREFPYVWT